MRRLRLGIPVAGVHLWLIIGGLPFTTHAAPVLKQVRPEVGQVGHLIVIRGAGLAGADIEVKFGRAEAPTVHNTGGSDRVISLLVPNKVDPRDPDRVTLAVTVDGIDAISPDGPLQFTYTVPQPSPAITDFTTGDPSQPKIVLQDEPFVLTLYGSNFLTGRRVPQRCMALQGTLQIEADGLVGSPGDTNVSFAFRGLPFAGDYEFLLAFSDGSGASVPAPAFVIGERPPFNSPPSIESVSFDSNPQQTVRCDFTQIVEDSICSLGVPGATAQPGVFIEGTFTHVRVQARVTDPDSTPTRSDVLIVAASYIDPATHSELSLILLDDGSLNVFRYPQKAAFPEDCSINSDQSCTCSLKDYRADVGDTTANDAVFTRDMAFVDPGTLSSGLLQDCILQQLHDVPISAVVGSTLEFTIDAVDRVGNDTSWPFHPAVTPGAGSLACTGDECGCCFLTSGGTLEGCNGKPGLPSPDFPAGICMSIP